ncbi:pimeloyl-ACP methyl ester carboxylesterase [Actinomycetospora succinea]|uniref:Pimeloyl-ACP methyl ester carboxylesterase n=1 Tax=Actinomycetospora succinea TaxID=663603 RepID=A0A4R6VE53_9PSEU|nr:alpha/beta hydrolase [Actinomycetospora succinea]TDQ58700.1 pimeloyl-ACP methyl ester carboxylesterase [Actinomycetospora succinea]
MATVAVNGVELAVRTAGSGPTLVLVHGFPHTGAIWSDVAAAMSVDHRVVVPDLRGFGASTRTADGLDADTVSRDLEELIGAGPATLVAIDAGVPPAFLLGLRRPDLLTRLVLVEATLGSLPGAEEFVAGGAPWWFGFHRVPGLAERVLRGNEAEYVGWFYDQGTRGRGVRPELRAELGEAFAQRGALACALAYYRALPTSDRQIHDAVARGRLTVPTTAVGAAPVGRALEKQLSGVADDLTGHVIEECGHIVPVDRPDELVRLLRE